MALVKGIRLFGTQFCRALALKSCTRPVVARSFCNSSALFADRRYSEKHEWISVEGKIGTVGISKYAQEALGDIVYAQLPDVGTEVEQFAECGALESVKAASELYTPASGKVTKKNTAVEETPSIINRSCYEEGWLFKLEVSNTEELKKLMDETAYDAYTKAQSAEEH